MRSRHLVLSAAGIIVGVIITYYFFAAYEHSISEEEAEDIAIQAYIYGYPLMTLDLTKRVMTNVQSPANGRAPLGQFFHSRGYLHDQSKDVTAPSADMLYSTAWIDVSKEPYILSIASEEGRYYLMAMFSGWSEVFANPGTRTTGAKEQKLAIVGPYWRGNLPADVQEVRSPTGMVWILGRTYCRGTADDYEKVYALQDKYTLAPLSSYGATPSEAKGKVDTGIDMKTPVRKQLSQLSIEDYFQRMMLLMKDNPPLAEDAPILEKMKKIGLFPGHEFHVEKLSPVVQRGLKDVVKLAIDEIRMQEEYVGETVNGWVIALNTGRYGTDYLQRAYVAAVGLGANLPQDTVYPMTQVDSDGEVLNGANKYVLHLNKEEIPPVKGFWSLTMYNDRYFFSENSMNRYSVSPDNQLAFNEDGSVDIYLQHERPEKGKESNWLPAPKDDFILMLRLIWPDDSFWNGGWKPAAVKRIEEK